MTSNRVLTAIVCVMVVLGLTLAANAQNSEKAQRVTFEEAIKIQGQLVPAGSYTINHVVEGQNHIMVFRQERGAHQEFRFNCNMVQLPSKAKQTTRVYDTASGSKVLKSMTFAGDTYEHVFGE
jgi:Protein of unknown function (DUF2911)